MTKNCLFHSCEVMDDRVLFTSAETHIISTGRKLSVGGNVPAVGQKHIHAALALFNTVSCDRLMDWDSKIDR